MTTSYYDKNIEAMRSRFADVIELLEKPVEEVDMIDEESDVSAEVTDVCGKTVLIARKGDRIYQLDSLYDSEPMLSLWFKGLKDEWDLNAKLYMYGFGNGMYVRKFLDEARKDCSVVVHEPSYKIFKTALENFDLSDILTDVRVRLVFWPLHIGSSVKSVYEEIMSYTDLSSTAGSNYLNYAGLFPNDCMEYVYGLKRVKSFALANQIVHDRFGGDYNRNTFNNLGLIKDSYDLEELMEKVPGDIPAIVVAAGPSLDKNIKELANAKGKCIIISTDTALKPLSLAGIVPDIAAIMDGKKDERYLSEPDSRLVPLICTPRCGNEFLHLHTGQKFFADDFCMHINEFMKSVGKKLYRIPAGGSVANACFSIARLFKCKKIILVGQDLAYTGDKTHSAVTVRGAIKTEVEDLEDVEMDVDINGNPIRSSREFQLYKEWFEQQIDAYDDLEVIDATEGGIMIRGTKLMTLRQAIDEYCTREFDLAPIISGVAPLFDADMKEKFDRYIKEVPQEFSDLRRIIRATLADYTAMRKLVQSDNYHGQQMKKLYDSCQKQTKKIESSKVIEYVHNQLQGKSSELLDRVNKLEKDEKTELLTACDLGEQYLKDMDNAITELEPYMDIIRRDFH